MRKTMIIPTYWCRRTGELWQEGDAVYDHPTPVDQEGTLERTLLSMKQFHEKDFKLVILICPTTPEVEEEAYGQVLRITRRAQLNAETYLFTAGDLREMTDILHTTGLTDQGAKLLSMFGYGQYLDADVQEFQDVLCSVYENDDLQIITAYFDPLKEDLYSDAGIEYIRVVHARSDHFCTYQGVRLGDSAETYTSQDAGTSISTGTPYMTYVTDDGKLADLFSSSFAEISSLKDRVADISFVKD